VDEFGPCKAQTHHEDVNMCRAGGKGSRICNFDTRYVWLVTYTRGGRNLIQRMGVFTRPTAC